MKKWPVRVALGLVVTFVAIQVVPYGRDHDNPKVTLEPAWPAQSRALAVRACFDCHSNESVWPWYSNVAPVSWLVMHDVVDGRRHLNFSEWDKPQRHADDAAKELREGEMPMAIYPPLHPTAKLTDAERATLATALEEIAKTAIAAPGPKRDE